LSAHGAHIGGKGAGIGRAAALCDQQRSGDQQRDYGSKAQAWMRTRARTFVQARTISPMEIRIGSDHPPLTQVYRTPSLKNLKPSELKHSELKFSAGEERQLTFVFSSLRWSSGDVGGLPEKLPTSGKPQEEHRQRRSSNHVLIVGRGIPYRRCRNHPGRAFGVKIPLSHVKFSPR
jgi:hypothetical protein